LGNCKSHEATTHPLFDEIRRDFDLSQNNPQEFKARINRVSKLLRPNGEAMFIDDYRATYFVGNITDGLPKDILFGINPGFNPRIDRKQGIGNLNTWDGYLGFMEDFFEKFEKEDAKVPYYRTLSGFFGPLNNENLTGRSEMWHFYATNLITLELIPFHSTRTSFPGTLNPNQRSYLKNRLNLNLDFLKELNVRTLVFNGKAYRTLLEELLDTGIKLNERLTIYFFDCNGYPSVLFDKFVPSAAAAASKLDLQTAATKFNEWILREGYRNTSV
jgi:hypothetical protein